MELFVSHSRLHIELGVACSKRTQQDTPTQFVTVCAPTSCSSDSGSNTASFLSTILMATRVPEALWRPSFTTAKEPLVVLPRQFHPSLFYCVHLMPEWTHQKKQQRYSLPQPQHYYPHDLYSILGLGIAMVQVIAPECLGRAQHIPSQNAQVAQSTPCRDPYVAALPELFHAPPGSALGAHAGPNLTALAL